MTQRVKGKLQSCRDCKFYFIEAETRHDLVTDRPLHEDDYESECRRFPPDRIGKWPKDSGTQFEFFNGPIVAAMAWCGEWSQRDDE